MSRDFKITIESKSNNDHLKFVFRLAENETKLVVFAS
jgi:hypothetical protein